MKTINLNDLCRDSRERAQRYAADAQNTRRYVANHRDAIDAMVAALPDAYASEGAVLEVSADENSINVTLAGSREAMLAVWGALRSTVGEPVSRMATDGSDSQYFSTYFGTDGSSLRVWFSYTSTSCRRRQVGTKMVETPVYVMECR